VERGSKSGRVGSPRPPGNVAARFSALARLGFLSGGALGHVLGKLRLMTVGAAYVSTPVRRLRMRLDRAGPPPDLRAAIVAHAYYPELIGEILRCRGFLPPGAPVFITAPPERMAAAREALAGADGVTLIETPNRGRDIAPLLQVLRSGALAPFGAVLKLHTKRSPHLLDGDIRRKLLFDMLCGSRAGVGRVLTQFLNPATGLVGWRPSFRSAPVWWMDNRERVEELARQLGVEGGAPLGFFEGSMFWFRPAAFDALADLDLAADAFEPEAGQVDGTLHHALERLFTIAAWSRGYVARDLEGRLLAGALASQRVN